MNATSILRSLGAIVSAILVYWTGVTRFIAPPVEQSVGFFLVLCTIVGLLLTAALQFLRADRRTLRPWIFVVALAAAVFGIAGFFKYHAEWESRVAQTGDPNSGAYTVIALKIVPEAIDIMRLNNFAACRDTVRRRDINIPIDCAKEAAAHLQGGTDELFDRASLAQSRRILSIWYQVLSACFLLAMFLFIDEALAKTKRVEKNRERARRQNISGRARNGRCHFRRRLFGRRVRLPDPGAG